MFLSRTKSDGRIIPTFVFPVRTKAPPAVDGLMSSTIHEGDGSAERVGSMGCARDTQSVL